MGVSRLAVSQQCSLTSLTKQLDAMADEPSGRWHVSCSYLRPLVPGEACELFVLATSEAEAHHVVSVGRGVAGSAAGRLRVVEAGPQIGSVLAAVQSHVQRSKVTAEGTVHRCGDFVVRLAQLFLNATPAGVAVEVEYLPSTDAAAKLAPLDQFLDLVLPPAQRDFCSAADGAGGAMGLSDRFGTAHTALQFVGMVRARLLTT